MNVEGTRRVLEFARSCARLDRFSYVSTAYVAGEPAVFREAELAVNQRFRNRYERSKFEAEVALRSEGAGLPVQILRPSIVVGEQHGPHVLVQRPVRPPEGIRERRGARDSGAARLAGGHRSGGLRRRDRVHELATRGATGRSTSWRGAMRRRSGGCSRCPVRGARARGARPVLPPRLYRAWVHPWLRRKYRGLRRTEVDLPTSRCACASTTSASAPVHGSRATSTGWCATPRQRVGAEEVGPTLVSVIEKLVEQIEGRFAELSEQMSDPE